MQIESFMFFLFGFVFGIVTCLIFSLKRISMYKLLYENERNGNFLLIGENERLRNELEGDYEQEEE